MKKVITRVVALCLVLALSLIGLASCKPKNEGLQNEDVKYVVLTIKDMGRIVIELDRASAPKTVENFVDLVMRGFYDGLTFHRVMAGFMIQGGAPNGLGSGNSGATIPGEFVNNGHPNFISHVRGVISMARADHPDSASCQFFICVADSTFLDGNYAGFGYVLEGMEVADAIVEATAHLATDGNGGGIPVADRCVIEKAEAFAEYPTAE